MRLCSRMSASSGGLRGVSVGRAQCEAERDLTAGGEGECLEGLDLDVGPVPDGAVHGAQVADHVPVGIEDGNAEPGGGREVADLGEIADAGVGPGVGDADDLAAVDHEVARGVVDRALVRAAGAADQARVRRALEERADVVDDGEGDDRCAEDGGAELGEPVERLFGAGLEQSARPDGGHTLGGSHTESHDRQIVRLHLARSPAADHHDGRRRRSYPGRSGGPRRSHVRVRSRAGSLLWRSGPSGRW